MDNKDIIKELDNLIELLRDGQEGYRLASENTDDHELKSVLSRYSEQRATFAGELQQHQHELGKSDAEDDTSVKGKLHRGWIDIKTAVKSNDRESILKECERGDDHAIQEYTKASEKGLPGNIQSTLVKHLADIETSKGRIQSLQRATV
jgi:uncharacterized protein (TIGR02284 family)